MSVISFSHVYYSYSTIDVLQDISFTCASGQRLCLVGPNGAGKSTILKVANGQLDPLSGSVHRPSTTDPGVFEATYVKDLINNACGNLLALRAEFERVSQKLADDNSAELSQRYDELLNQLASSDAWSLETRIHKTFEEFGLGAIEQHSRLECLSPGQVARLELATLLLQRRQALILDEPTNHLDKQARQYLTDIVLGWDGPVLFTSHDRDFIETVATGILDLDTAPWRAQAQVAGAQYSNGVHYCAGNYSDYLQQKEDARKNHASVHAQQQDEKRYLKQHRIESEVVGHRDFKPRSEVRMSKKYYADRAQTVSTRRINDDTTRLKDLASREVRKPRHENIEIHLPQVTHLDTGIAVSVRQGAVPGRLLPQSFELGFGEQLLVTGPNGSGKSTLLHWISDGPPPGGATGTVSTQDCVLIPQQLPQPGDTLFSPEVWDTGTGEIGKGFLHPRFWSTPLGELSDGNKRRAQIAMACAENPTMLILDEPTNYLDLETVESLEKALLGWNGTLVIATHDQWLINKWQVTETGAHRRRIIHTDPDPAQKHQIQNPRPKISDEGLIWLPQLDSNQ